MLGHKVLWDAALADTRRTDGSELFLRNSVVADAEFPARIWPWIVRVLRGLMQYRKSRKDYADLLGMPDHILRDVGLTRADIRAEIDRSRLLGGLWLP